MHKVNNQFYNKKIKSDNFSYPLLFFVLCFVVTAGPLSNISLFLFVIIAGFVIVSLRIHSEENTNEFMKAYDEHFKNLEKENTRLEYENKQLKDENPCGILG